jgi:hypothetical protein
MKVFLGLKGHANSESLPLRFGLQITEIHQQFATLENAVFDELGTNKQRPDEVERGNRHYLGDLCIPNIVKGEAPICHSCRIVLGSPKHSNQAPPVVTILRQEYSHGDITVTKHISGMVKRGRITVLDIINFLHPSYIDGNIADSNDIEEIYANVISPSREPKIISTSRSDDAIIESADEIKKIINDFSIDDSELTAPLKFSPMKLNDKVKYAYSMADAYIENAWIENGKILIDVIGTNGQIKRLHSFKQRYHLMQHHKLALDYLQSRIGQRGYFALCMSDPCKGFLAESVTSITLQLMKE